MLVPPLLCLSLRLCYAVDASPFWSGTHELDLPILVGSTSEGELGKLDLFRANASAVVNRRFQGTLLDFVHGGEPDWSRYDAISHQTRLFVRVDREESAPQSDRRLA